MPKQKINRSAAKRFNITGSGKISYKKKGMRHILTKKRRKRKQDLRSKGILSPVEAKRVRSLLRV